MPDVVFHFIAYVLPVLVFLSVGGLGWLGRSRLAGQPQRSRSTTFAIVGWVLTSLIAIAAGFVAGRLYDYAVAVGRHTAGDGLPLRPGLIVLGFVAVQAAAGSFFVRALRLSQMRANGNVA